MAYHNLIKLAEQSESDHNAGIKGVGAGLAAAGIGLGTNYVANRMMTNVPAVPAIMPTAEEYFGGKVPNWDKLQKMKNTLQGDIDTNSAQPAAHPGMRARIDKINEQLQQKKAYDDMQQAHKTTRNAGRLKALGLAGAGALGLYAGYKGIQALRNRSNNTDNQSF